MNDTPPKPAVGKNIASVEEIIDGLGDIGYIASRRIATAIFIARWLGLPLIRMQCYEGLDESKALYEWKYGKQLLYTQILKDKMGETLTGTKTLEDAMGRLHGFSDLFFSEQFLEPRPLLKALRQEHGAVLLIDEIDKSDEEFEAFLLEVLSEFQVSIPEIGTIKATKPPLVFLTSNNMREMGDALKRRCLHLFIPLPDAKLEQRIVAARVPDIDEKLKRQLVAFVQLLRQEELKKFPSISETIDWARVLMLLHAESLNVDLVRDTLNVLLKFEQDFAAVRRSIPEITRKATRE
jgi:MoxR-like ATPase